MKLPEDFCEWLFDIMDIPFARQMDWKLKHQRSPNERKYNNVYRYTRAGKSGKFVMCPHCHADTRVYHFSWAAMTCNNCMASVDKNDWLEIDWKY